MFRKCFFGKGTKNNNYRVWGIVYPCTTTQNSFASKITQNQQTPIARHSANSPDPLRICEENITDISTSSIKAKLRVRITSKALISFPLWQHITSHLYTICKIQLLGKSNEVYIFDHNHITSPCDVVIYVCRTRAGWQEHHMTHWHVLYSQRQNDVTWGLMGSDQETTFRNTEQLKVQSSCKHLQGGGHLFILGSAHQTSRCSQPMRFIICKYWFSFNKAASIYQCMLLIPPKQHGDINHTHSRSIHCSTYSAPTRWGPSAEWLLKTSPFDLIDLQHCFRMSHTNEARIII